MGRSVEGDAAIWKTRWKALTQQQQQSARVLGYTKSNWPVARQMQQQKKKAALAQAAPGSIERIEESIVTCADWIVSLLQVLILLLLIAWAVAVAFWFGLAQQIWQ